MRNHRNGLDEHDFHSCSSVVVVVVVVVGNAEAVGGIETSGCIVDVSKFPNYIYTAPAPAPLPPPPLLPLVVGVFNHAEPLTPLVIAM